MIYLQSVLENFNQIIIPLQNRLKYFFFSKTFQPKIKFRILGLGGLKSMYINLTIRYVNIFEVKFWSALLTTGVFNQRVENNNILKEKLWLFLKSTNLHSLGQGSSKCASRATWQKANQATILRLHKLKYHIHLFYSLHHNR